MKTKEVFLTWAAVIVIASCTFMVGYLCGIDMGEKITVLEDLGVIPWFLRD